MHQFAIIKGSLVITIRCKCKGQYVAPLSLSLSFTEKKSYLKNKTKKKQGQKLELLANIIHHNHSVIGRLNIAKKYRPSGDPKENGCIEPQEKKYGVFQQSKITNTHTHKHTSKRVNQTIMNGFCLERKT